MALRSMEVTLPVSFKNQVQDLFNEVTTPVMWFGDDSGQYVLAKATLPTEKTQGLMDALDKLCGAEAGFHLNLLPLEAVLPRPVAMPAPSLPEKVGHVAVSREELYNDIADASTIHPVYIAMVVLSTLVAVFGIHYENIAAIIGAMVIAPLLGPNVALSFATTLGDFDLIKKSIKINLLGLAIAFTISVGFGFLLSVDVTNVEVLVRTQVRPGDLVLALASGAAGVLAFTSGASAMLIGVMVAVALLPPLVTFGLVIAAGNVPMAVGAGTLLITNVICINLAGVITFLLQGIRPQNWWEKGKARKATAWAITLWSLLLITFALVIIFAKVGHFGAPLDLGLSTQLEGSRS